MGSSTEPKTRNGGLIGYYGLAHWWESIFSPEEREYIEAVFQPLGGSSNELTHGVNHYVSQSAPAFLGNLAGWFSKVTDRHIAYRLLAKASELAEVGCGVLDLHFLDHTLIKFCYRDRDKPGKHDAAIAACEHQISIAPIAAQAFLTRDPDCPLPAHIGYKQLAIIREKQGDLSGVITLCQQAVSQGWPGDWKKRIDRCVRRKSRGKNPQPA